MEHQRPQSEIDATFRELTAGLFAAGRENSENTDESIATLNDHYVHLKGQGYSENEIADYFDLVMDREKVYEIENQAGEEKR